MRRLTTRAPAKVNLTLHVLGRRLDGYHELESLVVFAGVADLLTLVEEADLSLSVDGPTAPASGPIGGNLVMRAAGALAERESGIRLGRFHLTKRLPAAAGIGGGSSDAAAALRLLAELNELPLDHPSVADAARATGADVPVCLDPSARMMAGAGERIGPSLGLPPLFAVLVNPGVAVPTPQVFRALALHPGDRTGREPHPEVSAGEGIDAVLARLREGGNDMEPAAVALQPIIGEAIGLLRAAEGCRLARMSGSGATVFGLFDTCHAASRAARSLRTTEPGWWVKPTVLR